MSRVSPSMFMLVTWLTAHITGLRPTSCIPPCFSEPAHTPKGSITWKSLVASFSCTFVPSVYGRLTTHRRNCCKSSRCPVMLKMSIHSRSQDRSESVTTYAAALLDGGEVDEGGDVGPVVLGALAGPDVDAEGAGDVPEADGPGDVPVVDRVGDLHRPAARVEARQLQLRHDLLNSVRDIEVGRLRGDPRGVWGDVAKQRVVV
eukprot:764694-Hanusia_phi.AAC.3